MKLKLMLTLLVLNLSLASTLHADENAVLRGRAAYEMHCLRCHGAEGKGNGVDAKRMTVVPRDLTSGKFKFKSTVYGTPPSDEDLIKGVLGHGLAGSGMPSFGNLDKAVRADLVAYIKTISPIYANDAKPQPIPDPANRRAKPDLIKGKEVFTKMQCASCHGANGRANGSGAFTLVDAWGRPIQAANLTQGWTYRGGSEPIDIYHRILAGIEGAPMPSYEGAASHEDIWQMCNYVHSLQLKANWSGQIDAPKVTGNLPLNSDDSAWDKAPRTDINMQNYLYTNGHRSALTVKAVSVQSLVNENSIAFKISWDDPIENSSRGAVDSLLVAIKPADYNGDTRGNLYNLYSPEAPVLDVVVWNASNPKQLGEKKATLAATTGSSWNPAQILEATSKYEDGRWTLVFVRPLELEGAEKLKDGELHYIGFSAWDGQNKETGMKSSLSQWIRLHIGDSKEHK